MVDSFLGGIAYHRKRMSGMNLKEKPLYLLKRVRYRTGRLKHSLAQWAIESLVDLRQTFPRGLRDMYVFERNLHANHTYKPGTWDGRITYFHGENGLPQDPAAFWSEVATQGVDIHSVPGTGVQLFRKPNVGAVGDALKVALKRAREASIARYAAISSDRV